MHTSVYTPVCPESQHTLPFPARLMNKDVRTLTQTCRLPLDGGPCPGPWGYRRRAGVLPKARAS